MKNRWYHFKYHFFFHGVFRVQPTPLFFWHLLKKVHPLKQSLSNRQAATQPTMLRPAKFRTPMSSLKQTDDQPTGPGYSIFDAMSGVALYGNVMYSSWFKEKTGWALENQKGFQNSESFKSEIKMSMMVRCWYSHCLEFGVKCIQDFYNTCDNTRNFSRLQVTSQLPQRSDHRNLQRSAAIAPAFQVVEGWGAWNEGPSKNNHAWSGGSCCNGGTYYYKWRVIVVMEGEFSGIGRTLPTKNTTKNPCCNGFREFPEISCLLLRKKNWNEFQGPKWCLKGRQWTKHQLFLLEDFLKGLPFSHFQVTFPSLNFQSQDQWAPQWVNPLWLFEGIKCHRWRSLQILSEEHRIQRSICYLGWWGATENWWLRHICNVQNNTCDVQKLNFRKTNRLNSLVVSNLANLLQVLLYHNYLFNGLLRNFSKKPSWSTIENLPESPKRVQRRQ